MSAKRFGTVLKQLREKAGLNQSQLAERLGVDQASVSRWERGQGEPGVSMVKPLAAILGVSAESLINVPAAKPARKPKKK
jgi:transcriptional regulator with XRE-family HTH domain